MRAESEACTLGAGDARSGVESRASSCWSRSGVASDVICRDSSRSDPDPFLLSCSLSVVMFLDPCGVAPTAGEMYVYVVVEREIFLVNFVRIKAACMYYKASISISKHN